MILLNFVLLKTQQKKMQMHSLPLSKPNPILSFHFYTQNFEKQVLETNNENKAKQNFTR